MGRRSAVPLCPRDLGTIYACFNDETRRRILNLLIRGPLWVQQIEKALGLLQSLVSRHLGYLRRRGMVQAERTEQHRVLYSLPAVRSPELQANLDCLEKCARGFKQYAEDLRQLEAAELQSEK
jgi:ArsR family transcriptional regulator